ncbi:MAG: hypothetical protein WCJ56_01010 [bacterium]
MSKKFCYIFATIVALLLMSMAMSTAQTAAPANVGVLQLGTIGKEFAGYRSVNDRITAYYKERQDISDNLRKGEFLTQVDFTEYLRYVGKSTIINPDRVKVLQELSVARAKRWEELKLRETPVKLTYKEADEFNSLDFDNAANFKTFLESNNITGDRISSVYNLKPETIDNMRKGEFLSQEEFKEYLQLVSVTPVVNVNRVKALQDKSAARSSRWAELKMRAFPSPLSVADRAELTAMASDDTANSKIIMDSFNKFKKEAQDEEKRLYQVIDEFQKSCIKTVAEKNNLTIVLSQDVIADKSVQRLVLWGGLDITDQVVALMKANFKPEMLDAK